MRLPEGHSDSLSMCTEQGLLCNTNCTMKLFSAFFFEVEQKTTDINHLSQSAFEQTILESRLPVLSFVFKSYFNNLRKHNWIQPRKSQYRLVRDGLYCEILSKIHIHLVTLRACLTWKRACKHSTIPSGDVRCKSCQNTLLLSWNTKSQSRLFSFFVVYLFKVAKWIFHVFCNNILPVTAKLITIQGAV